MYRDQAALIAKTRSLGLDMAEKAPAYSTSVRYLLAPTKIP
jgi:hypothetical protein